MSSSTLLHCSDPHFGTELPALCDGLRALVAQWRPDAVVVSGDLTQRATRTQFSRARDFLDHLGAGRMFLLPGNHDIPMWNLGERLLRPWGAWRRALGETLEPQLDLGPFQLTGVNTSRAWRRQGGCISLRQRERVAARLAACPAGHWPVVVTHHPVQVRRPEDAADRAWGGPAALRRWSRVGQPLILGGHTHDPFVARWSADPDTTEGPGAWVLQSGTALSSRVRHGRPQSVTLLRAAPQGASQGLRPDLQVWRYDWDGRAFQVAQACLLGQDGRLRAGETPVFFAPATPPSGPQAQWSRGTGHVGPAPPP